MGASLVQTGGQPQCPDRAKMHRCLIGTSKHPQPAAPAVRTGRAPSTRSEQRLCAQSPNRQGGQPAGSGGQWGQQHPGGGCAGTGRGALCLPTLRPLGPTPTEQPCLPCPPSPHRAVEPRPLALPSPTRPSSHTHSRVGVLDQLHAPDPRRLPLLTLVKTSVVFSEPQEAAERCRKGRLHS